jgi:hypothetical protein
MIRTVITGLVSRICLRAITRHRVFMLISGTVIFCRLPLLFCSAAAGRQFCVIGFGCPAWFASHRWNVEMAARQRVGLAVISRRMKGPVPARNPLGLFVVWGIRRSLQPPLCQEQSASGSLGTVSLRSRTNPALWGFRSRLAWPRSTTPRGTSGTGPITPPAEERLRS